MNFSALVSVYAFIFRCFELQPYKFVTIFTKNMYIQCVVQFTNRRLSSVKFMLE